MNDYGKCLEAIYRNLDSGLATLRVLADVLIREHEAATGLKPSWANNIPWQLFPKAELNVQEQEGSIF